MANPYVRGFNQTLHEFVGNLREVFPDDATLCTIEKGMDKLIKANPVIIVKCWKPYVLDKFQEQINAGDLDYFIDYDYTHEVQTLGAPASVLTVIEQLRAPMRNMSTENKSTCVLFLQRLNQLCAASGK